MLYRILERMFRAVFRAFPRPFSHLSILILINSQLSVSVWYRNSATLLSKSRDWILSLLAIYELEQSIIGELNKTDSLVVELNENN